MLEKLEECPDEIADMVRRCDDTAETKTLTKVWYRSPWQLLLGRFQRGTVTVAGDAMHVMGPYIGQGGSAALEDAVVLARTLSRSVPDGEVVVDGSTRRDSELQEKISVALGQYVRERRARLFMLSLESYVIGTSDRQVTCEEACLRGRADSSGQRVTSPCQLRLWSSTVIYSSDGYCSVTDCYYVKIKESG